MEKTEGLSPWKDAAEKFVKTFHFDLLVGTELKIVNLNQRLQDFLVTHFINSSRLKFDLLTNILVFNALFWYN